MIPGSNILRMALGAIAAQAVPYRRYTGTTTRADGIQVPTFAAPVTLYGSWQPVSADQLVRWGLDPAKKMAIFYVSAPLNEPGRDISGDRADYAGSEWEARDADGEWFPQDGWTGMLFQRIGPTGG